MQDFSEITYWKRGIRTEWEEKWKENVGITEIYDCEYCVYLRYLKEQSVKEHAGKCGFIS